MREKEENRMEACTLELIERACCLCNSEDAEELLCQPIGSISGLGDVNYVANILCCRECGFVYASPVPSQEVLARYYAAFANYENRYQPGGAPGYVSREHFEQVHTMIRGRFPSPFKGRVLEIGCGVAYLLSLFKADGWDALGIDPSKRCGELSKELYDVDCLTGSYSFSLLRDQEPFDLIILSQVLEHLISPQEVVSDLTRFLAPGGLLYVEVPNIYYPDCEMGYYNFEHLNYFTPNTLASLMQRYGFSYDYPYTYGRHPLHYTWKMAPQPRISVENEFTLASDVVRKYDKTAQEEIERLQRKIRYILARTAPGRVAVWGAGIHTSQLLSFTGLSSRHLCCIFDNDPRKRGMSLSGISVMPLEGDLGKLKTRLDAILISSRAFELDIYRQISFLENHGIKVYRLYDIEENIEDPPRL